MNDLGTFNDELIRLGPEDGNHMDMTADGIDLLEGNTSVANFTREGSRMGEEDKGHVNTTAQGVTVWDGTSDVPVATMGTGAVDFHDIPVDGMYIPNGQMAATSVYSWAEETGWLKPTNIVHEGGHPLFLVRGEMGWVQDGSPEVTVQNGYVAFGLTEDGLLITLNNQDPIQSQRKSGTVLFKWDGTIVSNPS